MDFRLYCQHLSIVLYLYRSHTNPNDNTSVQCGGVPADSMHLFRDATPGASDLPWTGMVFGIAVSAVWYWCSDQVAWIFF